MKESEGMKTWRDFWEETLKCGGWSWRETTGDGWVFKQAERWWIQRRLVEEPPPTPTPTPPRPEWQNRTAEMCRLGQIRVYIVPFTEWRIVVQLTWEPEEINWGEKTDSPRFMMELCVHSSLFGCNFRLVCVILDLCLVLDLSAHHFWFFAFLWFCVFVILDSCHFGFLCSFVFLCA